jgi:hypothetical protein
LNANFWLSLQCKMKIKTSYLFFFAYPSIYYEHLNRWAVFLKFDMETFTKRWSVQVFSHMNSYMRPEMNFFVYTINLFTDFVKIRYGGFIISSHIDAH